MTEGSSSPAARGWLDRLPKVIEVALALVIAFSLGRLTVDTSSAASPSGFDIAFSQNMAVHHEQAVLMANLAQTRGGPAVAALADAILVNQSQEIGLLRGWLKIWHRPSTTMTAASMSTSAMPGMATPDQLTRLSELSGKRFDILFLQLMIRHHQGGLEMCRDARIQAKLAIVRDAAAAMAVEQIDDLGQMQALLKSDGGTPLPSPL